jgi:hypothetical protein
VQFWPGFAARTGDRTGSAAPGWRGGAADINRLSIPPFGFRPKLRPKSLPNLTFRIKIETCSTPGQGIASKPGRRPSSRQFCNVNGRMDLLPKTRPQT